MIIEKEVKERFEGFEDLQLKSIFNHTVRKVIKDFQNEGFDNEEITKYLQYRIEQIMNRS